MPEFLTNCVSLELDTKGQEGNGGPKPLHICPLIRKAISRLQYLRLRLTNICPDICGFGFDSKRPTAVTDTFKPEKVPFLKECVINLGMEAFYGPVYRSHICNVSEELSRDGCVTIVAHLQTLVFSKNAPQLKKLRVLDGKRGKEQHRSYATLVRRDICADKSQALPFRQINSGAGCEDGWLIRMPLADKGLDLLSSLQGIEEFAEGQTWQETSNRARMPAPVIAARAISPAPIVQTSSEWRTRCNVTCMLWENERATGMRLLDAQDGALMENMSCWERTPNGWKRERPLGDFLVKA